MTTEQNQSPSLILRRLGPDAKVNRCTEGLYCPDLFELTDGTFAVIGTDITEEIRRHLPASAGCGPNERIVRLPRDLLVGVKSYIPDA